MLELRQRNAKNKGLLFEVFCVLYLQSKGYECWMLKDVPADILSLLGLTRHDIGIDLIASYQLKNKDSKSYYAVQCKYRSPTNAYVPGVGLRTVHRVIWKDVSTFLSLCTRTGPFQKHIIMTNALTVSWKGRKTDKDYTIARKTFCNQPSSYWIKWLSPIEASPQSTGTSKPSEERLSSARTERLRWLDEKFPQK